jgi:nicotinamide phosphoribosyltransferase
MMKKYLEETGCENIDGVLPFMLHDFGFRGASSLESACIGGAAHLTNFFGSDTYSSMDWISEYYGDDLKMWGYSIPASNHAVITSWENESDAFQNVLDQYLGKDKIVACVSDSYDFYKAIDTWGTKFKKQIEESGGRLVVRPDSGSPVYVSISAIQKLMEYFGYTTNYKGYKVLPNHVRVIWGDGINPARIEEVLYAMQGAELASENIVFGMGAALLQQVDRDVCSFAFKVNEIVSDGIRRPVFKNPVTGRGKASKAGRQALVIEDWKYKTIPEAHLGDRDNILRTVFRDGKLLIDDSFDVIRERANENFNVQI